MNNLRLAALVAALCPVAVYAETALNPIVVSATRTPITTEDSLASVTVLTRKDIERQQASDIPDLLSTLTGVSVTRNGGLGKDTSVRIRGSNDEHVLVMVDGVRVGSATLGAASLQNLSLGEVERIEVVRGPRSSLYGSDAIGGIVHIFTRGADPHVSVGGGTDGTYEASAGAGFETDRASLGINFSHLETSGFDAQENQGSGNPNEPDDDGFRQRGINVHGRYQFSDSTKLRATALQTLGETEYDGSPNTTDFRQQVYSLRLLTRPVDWWDLTLGAGYNEEQDDNFDDGANYSSFTTQRRTATLQNDFALGDNHLTTVGVDYTREHIDTTQDFTEDKRSTWGYFAQHQWYGETLNAQAGLRYDDDTAFDSHTTGNVALGVAFARSAKAYASYGTAYKAPTFNDLYWPEDAFAVGNPDLDPETSQTYELGVEYGRELRLAASVYRTEAEDLIVWAMAPGTGKFMPQNVNDAVINGADLEMTAVLAPVRTQLGLTYLDAEDEETGNRLPRRAEYQADLDVSARVWRLTLGGHVQYRGDSYDDLDNETELDAYTVVDLRAALQLHPEWRLTGKVGNALDEDYQTADTYNSWGRHYLASVTWRPR